jgi:hypothetical protein
MREWSALPTLAAGLRSFEIEGLDYDGIGLGNRLDFCEGMEIYLYTNARNEITLEHTGVVVLSHLAPCVMCVQLSRPSAAGCRPRRVQTPDVCEKRASPGRRVSDDMCGELPAVSTTALNSRRRAAIVAVERAPSSGDSTFPGGSRTSHQNHLSSCRCLTTSNPKLASTSKHGIGSNRPGASDLESRTVRLTRTS